MNWVSANFKGMFEDQSFWRKVGTLLVMSFPAVILAAWVVDEPTPLRVSAAIGAYLAIVIFYAWETASLTEARNQPRRSIAELWSEGSTAQRVRLIVFLVVALVLVVISAIAGFTEGAADF